MGLMVLMMAAGIAVYVVITRQINKQLNLVTDLYNVGKILK